MERSSGAAPPRRVGVGKPDKGDELLQVEVERADQGVSVVALAGELDLSTTPKLEEQLFDARHSDQSVVVDLTRLSFIDSSGIGLLIKAHQDANGARAVHIVIAVGSQVERVFAIAAIAETLPVFVDRDDAIAAAYPDRGRG